MDRVPGSAPEGVKEAKSEVGMLPGQLRAVLMKTFSGAIFLSEVPSHSSVFNARLQGPCSRWHPTSSLGAVVGRAEGSKTVRKS